jgi:hypothetical protein
MSSAILKMSLLPAICLSGIHCFKHAQGPKMGLSADELWRRIQALYRNQNGQKRSFRISLWIMDTEWRSLHLKIVYRLSIGKNALGRFRSTTPRRSTKVKKYMPGCNIVVSGILNGGLIVISICWRKVDCLHCEFMRPSTR